MYYILTEAREVAAVIGESTASAGPAIVVRVRARAGRAGLWLAQACCCVLVVTLAWGSHWPLGPLGLAAPPYGVFDSVFDLADVLFVGIVAGWGLALLSGQDRIGFSPRW